MTPEQRIQEYRDARAFCYFVVMAVAVAVTLGAIAVASVADYLTVATR